MASIFYSGIILADLILLIGVVYKAFYILVLVYLY